MGIQVKDLHFSYGSHEVLKGLSFSLQPGRVACLLGKNGAGKSTLFRCLLGLSSRYRGEISLGGRPIRNLSRTEFAKKIAYIPQSGAPTFNFTVMQVVLMGRAVHISAFSTPKPEDERAAEAALETLGIAHLRDAGYAQISGGERQLVTIARALAQQAGILVMDEPTANLDYGNQYRVLRQVHDLSRQGYLILFSSHNPEHAFLFADEALVLEDGLITLAGAPAEILTQQTLEELYEIPILLSDMNCEGRSVRVCMPRSLS